MSTRKRGQRFPSLEAREGVLVELLRAARRAARLRQIDLAENLGLSQTVISNVERGARPLSVMELRDWLRALGLDFVEFAEELDRLLAEGRFPPVGVARPVAKWKKSEL